MPLRKSVCILVQNDADENENDENEPLHSSDELNLFLIVQSVEYH